MYQSGLEFLINEKLLFIVYLIGVMVVGGIIKDANLFRGVTYQLYKRVESKRLFVFLISMISGILPIPGRTVISAMVLDTVAGKDKEKRQRLGIINYLSSHHYYLWSPLEKTVIFPMAVLSWSWIHVVASMLPLLLIVVLWILIFLYVVTEEKDIELSTIEYDPTAPTAWVVLPLVAGIGLLAFGYAPWTVFSVLSLCYMIVARKNYFPILYKFINWKLVAWLFGLIFVSDVIESRNDQVHSILEGIPLFGLEFWGVVLVTWWLTFILGSSSKYAGFVATLTSIFSSGLGVIEASALLCFFTAVDYSAYLVSPTHKCLWIAKEYFGVTFKRFYYTIGCVAVNVFLIGQIIGCIAAR